MFGSAYIVLDPQHANIFSNQIIYYLAMWFNNKLKQVIILKGK